MIVTKAALLAPAIKADLKNERLTHKDIIEINSFMFMVIMNNLYVIDKAKKNCNIM